jgi:ATP-dependent RNA helicase DDX19/DBP5
MDQVQAHSKVVLEQEDPTAMYLAAQTWDELNLPRELLDGIFEMGFVKPSKIQQWALPIAMEGRNIIGQAQNGFGKTAAFAIAMLLKVDAKWAAPQGLCICPTRELAAQNADVISKIGRFTGVDLFLAVPQAERMPRYVYAQIVVGTPGKLQDLIKKRTIDPSGFQIFVLDEADVMIDENNQMGPQVFQIRQLLPEAMQVLLFSATFPENVENFARKMVPKANTIKVQKEDLTLSTITQTFINVGRDARQKPEMLSSLYGALNISQSIIFVNTRTMAFELAKLMKEEGHAVSLICGTQQTGPERIDVTYRDRVMGEFRSGVTKVLIATDVLSRGIDVPAVTLVVNFELPLAFGRRGQPDYETYIHRIGRTGRFGLRGVAVNLVSQDERPLLQNIQHFYNCDIAELSGDLEEMQNMVRNLR